MKIAISAFLLLAAALLPGCATVTMGTSQDISIDAEPQGTECRVERRGAVFAIVRPTPGKVNVPRSSDTLTVICALDGHESATEHLSPTFSGATIGNVIAGGLIGIVVDAASGANNSYPDRVRMVLTPSAFDSVESRDRFFAASAERVRTRADAQIKDRRANCSSTQKELCELDVKQAEEGRERMLALLETKRQSARIGAGGATVAATPAVTPTAAATSTPVATPKIASPSSPVARVALPPGRDGVWRGVYSCRGSSTVPAGNVDAAIAVHNGRGEQTFASSGPQTHKLALAIVGSTATMTRTSETTGGRPNVTALNGTVDGDTIIFHGSETALTTTSAYGASSFTHCSATLQRGA